MNKTIFIFVFSVIATIFVHAENDPLALTDALIKYGKHSEYWNPLNYALEEKDYSASLILIKFVGDIDKRDGRWLPLDRLCNNSKEKLTREQEELFRIFFELNAKNSFGLSSKVLIFHKAANFGSLELINWLLSEGVDLSEQNGYPFLGAVSSGDVELVKYLLSLAPDLQNINGFLNTAISSHNLKLVIYVWEDLGLRPKVNWGNPLDVTIWNHDLDIFIYLLNAGLSPNEPHSFVLKRALSLPEGNENEKEYKKTVVKHLLEHGAKF